MNLASLNSVATCVGFKNTVKLRDLDVDKRMKIVSLKIVTTKFGPVPICELDNCTVFLPKRLTGQLSDAAAVEELLSGHGCYLVYRGEKQIKNSVTSLIEFIKIESS